jgi:asparagine synthase (glutamine-hydrolysing)
VCGICGICSPAAGLRPDAAAEVATMLGSIVHRGPDSSGAHVDGHAALGARRLAIIDLHGGDQPLYSEDGTVCLVYNGEVYNYRELRSTLRGRGHTLRSSTDSETIVHLYEDEGIELVERLNGMFAFALWDARRGRLFLARDRLGVKPLYYRWDGETLAFASEVKALLAAGRVAPRLDPDAFVELLTFQNILSERSLFQDVRLLPPAGILELDADGLRVRTFWDPLPRPDATLSGPDAATAVREVFDRAVERQLVSDVEVACYLSGGLDSSAVTASAVSHLPRLTTFTTGFDLEGVEGMEAGFDERREAAELAARIGAHHHDLVLDPHDLEMVLPRVVRHLEEPRMNFSYPNYLTAGLASRWVKVVLSSAGGDELFGGYPWRYALADAPDFPEGYRGFWTRLLTADELRDGLAPELAGAVDLARPRRLFDEVLERAAHLPPLDRVLYFELKTYLHGLLVVEDKLSMAHSLESRVPFLDNELVDLALEVPAAVKLAGGRSKDLFRRAMAERLPREVVERGKTGFTPPQAAWFRGPQDAYVRDVLLSERARGRGVLRPEFVERLVEEHAAGIQDRRLVLWTLLCMEWWHRIFVDGEKTA